MNPYNYIASESPMGPEMLYDDIDAAIAIDMDGLDMDSLSVDSLAMDGASFLAAAHATQTSLGLSPHECASAPPFEEMLTQTTLSSCFFPDLPLLDVPEGSGHSTLPDVTLAESFMISSQWLAVDSPTSTWGRTSLTTSPLESASPWTTPGPLQPSSPVAPLAGPHMFCPPPDVLYTGLEVTTGWPTGQVNEITAMPLLLPQPTAFSPYSSGQDQTWMNGVLPSFEPSDMSESLQMINTANFHSPLAPRPSKNTVVEGRQSRQRLTKAGRITKRAENHEKRPAKCPFPECEYAIKGFPYPSNVKKHVRIQSHRDDIDRLSPADQARFDLIKDPPQWYSCLEEGCQENVYAQRDQLLRHQTTHHGRPKQKPGQYMTTQTPI